MKTYKEVVAVLLFLFLCANGYGQGKGTTNTEIHFLVDTIGMQKENKFISIGLISPVEYGFTFYCKCIPPYDDYLYFAYRVGKNTTKAPIVDKKPGYKYISWKELLEIVGKYRKSFDTGYDLYITEVLPGNRYRTNKVKMVLIRDPTISVGSIKDKNR